MNSRRTTPIALVSGALANKPANGGNAWTRLDWAIGLKRLGYDAFFVEQISRSNCVDRNGARTSFAQSANLGYFRTVMAAFGLSEHSTLICDGGEEVFGLPLSTLETRAAEAALLLNISGHLTHQGLFEKLRCKVYFDDDPGFTQFWHTANDAAPRLHGHDAYFTIGQNIGLPECSIPAGKIDWKHTRPPVVLDHWPMVETGPFNRFTTVGSWRGAYAPIRHRERTLGLKAHEFRKFLQMPLRTGKQFEAALDIHPGDERDITTLRTHGWQLADPKQVADSPLAYRSYLQESAAEFSAAQGVYVQTNSGWFSDRTARYLASGKPALVQDTGFTRYCPGGDGLLSFSDIEEATEGAERIASDYQRHCHVARRIAEEYFDSDKVIGDLLHEIGLNAG